MIAALVSLLVSFLCIAIVLLLFVRKRQEFFYNYLLWLMRRNFRLLQESKNLLFYCSDIKTLDLAEDVLELTKETSLLLEKLKLKRLGDFSRQQLWACVDECCRVNKVLYSGLKKKKNSNKKSFHGFYTKRRRGILRGSCYFCSQPTLFSWFSRSKAVVHDKLLSVPSCHTCQGSLKKLKKINVLYFFYGKNKVHWSECGSYKPKFSYWLMNRVVDTKVERKGALLRLVINNKDTVLQ